MRKSVKSDAERGGAPKTPVGDRGRSPPKPTPWVRSPTGGVRPQARIRWTWSPDRCGRSDRPSRVKELTKSSSSVGVRRLRPAEWLCSVAAIGSRDKTSALPYADPLRYIKVYEYEVRNSSHRVTRALFPAWDETTVDDERDGTSYV